jgi:hypothetical protein
MTERIKHRLARLEALMAPPKTTKVSITIVYIDPTTRRPTGEVEYYPPRKDETKS